VEAVMKDVKSKESRWRRRIQLYAPYFITAAVLFFVLRRVSIDEIRQELSKGDGSWLFPIAMGVMLISLFLVSAADSLVCRSFLKKGRYFQFLRAKAASSLLDIIGYALGHGSYAFWIARVTDTKAGRAGGALLYIMAADLLAVTSIVTCALLFVDGEIGGGTIRTVVPAIALYLLFSLISGPWKFMPPKKKPPVLMPWVEVPRKIGFLQVMLRMCQIILFVSGTWLAAKTFGMPIPFSAAVTYMPVILLVTSLPINVAGFGVAQTAWLLLNDYAGEAQILAFQFLWQMSCIGAVALRGLPFVKGFVDETAAGKKSEPTQ
jgi:hypothetical protein